MKKKGANEERFKKYGFLTFVNLQRWTTAINFLSLVWIVRSHHTDADTLSSYSRSCSLYLCPWNQNQNRYEKLSIKILKHQPQQENRKKHKLLSCLHTPTSPFRTFQPHHHPIYFPSTIPQFFSSLSLPKNPNFFQIPHLLHFHFHFSHVKTPLPSPPPTCFPSHVMSVPSINPILNIK